MPDSVLIPFPDLLSVKNFHSLRFNYKSKPKARLSYPLSVDWHLKEKGGQAELPLKICLTNHH